MPSGSCARISELPPRALALVVEARRATLATRAPDDEPRLVPVCFAIRGDEIVTTIDAKPKSTHHLARLDNVARTGRASVLVDHWDEDWSRLGWVTIRGDARIDEAGSAAEDLVARYPQYETYAADGPVIAIKPTAIRWWVYSG